ncbi:MAG: methionine synthase [Synergistaceae bacterium]|nr:methionine synthase [Synergistaceae bacterium]MBQ6738094.1 methionine synthase [Synergistaceae bacterium]MBQ7068537.1 methionine synthase [Synergistaceae bacterium]MBR0074220.1 methionine synthase [Synergistaceae bacterium]MBR0079708.1 methionine synthase [Synergistaceae bacterium]
MRFITTDRSIANALRYMKVPATAKIDELIDVVREAFDRLDKFVTPRFLSGRFHIIHFDGGIEFEGCYIYSENIAKLTAHSNECYIIAMTLGHDVDREISLEQQRNMLDGLALDACASVRADEFCDYAINTEIVPYLNKGEILTHRFSPGYGDLDIKVTDDILQILNATKKIGLSTTSSMMMTPVKSITAIIGITHA